MKHQLSFGIQSGYAYKYINGDIKMADNFGANNEFDPGLNGENLLADNVGNVEANAGLMWTSNFSTSVSWYIGGSAYHLHQPKESFTASSIDLPMRITGHTGLELKPGKVLMLMPSVLYMQQASTDQLNAGMAIGFRFGEENNFQIGGYNRLNDLNGGEIDMDALIADMAFEVSGFRLGVSYDVSTFELNNAGGDTASLELSLNYTAGCKLPGIRKVLFCPRFKPTYTYY